MISCSDDRADQAVVGFVLPAGYSFNLAGTSIYMAIAVAFIAQGKVAWPATLTMMAGALVGGILGARLAQIVPREIMRAVVVVMGALLTAIFAWRYWF